MLGMYNKLQKLEQSGTPIMTSIVGAGQMGRGLVAQMMSMSGMRPAILVSRKISSAVYAFENAGLFRDKNFIVTEDVETADKAISEGKFIASTNENLATMCRAVHCVVEATGVPEVGARVALSAINSKKHIVMLNVEADVCVGHYLYKLANEAGVVYTGSAGDEPGAVMELYDFAKALGFEIKVIGKGKNNPIDYESTPDTSAAYAKTIGTSAKMVCSFRDGTKTMVEMTAMANATGFLPDIPGGHGAPCCVENLADLLSLKSEGRGGILNSYRVIEYIDGLAPGVFIIISTNQPEAIAQLEYLKIGTAPNFVLYRPYHICSLETPVSIARACIDKEPTIVPGAGKIAETCTVAKIDLKKGSFLDGIGGYTIRGLFMSAADACGINALPIGLVSEKTIMLRDVKKGEILTYNDVKLDENALIFKLRRLQDEMF